MRGFIVMAMFAVSLSHAGSQGYTEVRNLELDASGLSEMFIEAGAGAMVVTGVEGGDAVVVVATITVDTDDLDDGAKFIEKRLRLSLERDGDRARLGADFRPEWGRDTDAVIDLDVRMPAQLALVIDDGSGPITVDGIASNVRIDDGSGSIRLEDTGAVKIDDGSGSITIVRAAGDVYVEDGSGTIEIRGVQGSVTVDDGSGDIEIDDVEHDLVIEEEGSGSLRYTNVRGTVQQDD